jgi:hypothetical protein
MARSEYDPAVSYLDQMNFAGGNSISSPGGVSPNTEPNPYSAMAAEMVGEIAMNAGAEYMAPEGEWNEDLGKMVYTKKKYSSMFGPYTIPEDALWSDQVNIFMKQKEIEEAKEAKLKDNTLVNLRENRFQNMLSEEPFESSMIHPVSSDAQLELANEEVLNSKRYLLGDTYSENLAKYPNNEWLIRSKPDDPDRISIGNASSNLHESKEKLNAFTFVKGYMGNTKPEILMNMREEERADAMDEVRQWMGSSSTIIPGFDSVYSPAWKFFNENPELWQEFKLNPIQWYFTNKKEYGLAPEKSLFRTIFADDNWTEQNAAGKYNVLQNP